jgi:hypothetical protein
MAISTMMAAGSERGLELRLRLARPVVDDHRQRGEWTLQLLDESEQPTEQPSTGRSWTAHVGEHCQATRLRWWTFGLATRNA